MKSILSVLATIILIDALCVGYYFFSQNQRKNYLLMENEATNCQNEIRDSLETLNHCELFVSFDLSEAFVNMDSAFSFLKTQLNEYNNIPSGQKGIKAQVLKTNLDAFANNLNEARDKIDKRLSYFFYLFFFFNGLVLFAFIKRVFMKNTSILGFKTDRLKKLFLILLENNFSKTKNFYRKFTTVSFKEEFFSEDFLGSLFFSLLKINSKIIDYYKVAYIDIEMKLENNLFWVEQTIQFEIMNAGSILDLINQDMDYLIFTELIRDHKGEIDFKMTEDGKSLLQMRFKAD